MFELWISREYFKIISYFQILEISTGLRSNLPFCLATPHPLEISHLQLSSVRSATGPSPVMAKRSSLKNCRPAL